MQHKQHSITSFRNSFDDFIKKLPLLLDGREIGGSPQKNFFPLVKAIGLMRKNAFTQIGNYLKNIFQKKRDINSIISVIRIQIVYYLAERDLKMPFLDILSFLRKERQKADVKDIITFLQAEGYQLGENPELTVRSYIMSLLKGSGYIDFDKENFIYFIDDKKSIFVDKLLKSYLYKKYRANEINDDFYYKTYEKYYLTDNIISKLLFFRYGIGENK